MLARMSITVIIARGDTGAPTTREVYAEGAKFNIENGELGIISDRPQLVALYGSGNWLSVHMDDHVVVVTEKPEDSDSSGDLEFSSFGDSDDTSGDSADTSSDEADASSGEADTSSAADASTDSDDASNTTDSTDDPAVSSASTE